jgi:hypothetical protein
MLTVITEDSTSGFQFFKEILPILIDIPLNVVSSRGYPNLYTEFQNQLSKGTFKQDNRLLLCYDKFGVSDRNRRDAEIRINALYSLVNNIREGCEENKVQLREIDWFCFEELFICFSRISEIIPGMDTKFKHNTKNSRTFRFVG